MASSPPALVIGAAMSHIGLELDASNSLREIVAIESDEKDARAIYGCDVCTDDLLVEKSYELHSLTGATTTQGGRKMYVRDFDLNKEPIPDPEIRLLPAPSASLLQVQLIMSCPRYELHSLTGATTTRGGRKMYVQDFDLNEPSPDPDETLVGTISFTAPSASHVLHARGKCIYELHSLTGATTTRGGRKMYVQDFDLNEPSPDPDETLVSTISFTAPSASHVLHARGKCIYELHSLTGATTTRGGRKMYVQDFDLNEPSPDPDETLVSTISFTAPSASHVLHARGKCIYELHSLTGATTTRGGRKMYVQDFDLNEPSPDPDETPVGTISFTAPSASHVLHARVREGVSKWSLIEAELLPATTTQGGRKMYIQDFDLNKEPSPDPDETPAGTISFTAPSATTHVLHAHG
ncbi:hypothetical protein GUJ93_ZPchr0009g723 [Zizania palustris]|uniref:Uncharacterized protein n=1 Tax=Zizania palustris TaxID=103762 RepID=A0A8J5RR84_ZIZPA|nr:hypothetical protein GUJ93_ZPchr0009g723 [Zizania palustris]